MTTQTGRRAAAALVLAALALAGCSSKADAPASTPASVAAQIGCTGLQTKTASEMYARASGECTVKGDTYFIDTFASTADRDSWLKVAKQAGAPLGDYKSGDDWVAYKI